MLNIKNQVNYLKFFNFFVSIFLLLFFSFKNSLYSYLIFIIISNIIYYIFDKKNIFNFFFITVIITSILYIYLYNKKEGFKESYNNPQSDKIDKACHEISTSSLAELKDKSSDKHAVVNDKLGMAAATVGATAAASKTITSNLWPIKRAQGGQDVMYSLYNFNEKQKRLGETASNNVNIFTNKKKQLKTIDDTAEYVSDWVDNDCKNRNIEQQTDVSNFNQYFSGLVDNI